MIRQTPLYFVYGYLVSLLMVAAGALWCFAPARFLALYLRVVPFAQAARASDLERVVRSRSGRLCGGLIALIGLWIVLLLSAQVIRLVFHLAEPVGGQVVSQVFEFSQQGPG